MELFKTRATFIVFTIVLHNQSARYSFKKFSKNQKNLDFSLTKGFSFPIFGLFCCELIMNLYSVLAPQKHAYR